jgi:hypothetical protein
MSIFVDPRLVSAERLRLQVVAPSRTPAGATSLLHQTLLSRKPAERALYGLNTD